MQRAENETHESLGTETEPSRNDVESGTDRRLPMQMYGPPLCPPPVRIIHSTSGDQSEITSPNMSPEPVVCTAAFDVPSYDQDHTLRKPKPQFHGMRAHKNDKFALRRSYSAEALNFSLAGTVDTESHDQCLSSVLTDYPYVFHTFEVLGKDQAHVSSLPDVRQLSHIYASLETDNINPNPLTGVKPHATGKSNQSGIPYVNIGTVNFSKFELSYSYPHKRRMVRISPDSLPHKVSIVHSNDDHPSKWAPTSQLAKSKGSELPVHKLETNGIIFPPAKNTPKHKPKPQIPPRKKFTSQAAQRNDEANVGGQTPLSHKYTGLLSATRGSVHRYADLKGATELNELTVSIEAERAYPNEWCN